ARTPRALVASGIALAIVAAGVITWSLVRESRLHWARETAPLEVARLAAADDLVGAYRIARRAFQLAPDDSRVRQMWANEGLKRNLESDPPGADVAIHSYLRRDGE